MIDKLLQPTRRKTRPSRYRPHLAVDGSISSRQDLAELPGFRAAEGTYSISTAPFRLTNSILKSITPCAAAREPKATPQAQYFSNRLPQPGTLSIMPFVRYACHTVAVLIAITGFPSSTSNSAAAFPAIKFVPA
jgi:hypothetical protein